MDPSDNLVLRLRAQIASLEGILADLKAQLTDAEAYCNHGAQVDTNGRSQIQTTSQRQVQAVDHKEKTFESLIDQLQMPRESKRGRSWELAPEEYKRYGRQLIMPEIGLRGGPSFLTCNTVFSDANWEQDSYDLRMPPS